MIGEKSYSEDRVVEIIYHQGLHGRIIKHDVEEIDVEWHISSRWQKPWYHSPVLILDALGIDEEHLDNLAIGDVIEFQDFSAVLSED